MPKSVPQSLRIYFSLGWSKFQGRVVGFLFFLGEERKCKLSKSVLEINGFSWTLAIQKSFLGIERRYGRKRSETSDPLSSVTLHHEHQPGALLEAARIPPLYKAVHRGSFVLIPGIYLPEAVC